MSTANKKVILHEYRKKNGRVPTETKGLYGNNIKYIQKNRDS